jgi:glycosyltransferase involved in cell wall biosynthesis
MLQTGKSIPDASVVIPTFNGAARLPRVLAALVAQTAPNGSFEVVVVDNASTDATAAVARDDVAVAQLGARGIEVRVIAEPRQGLTYARIAGVAAARSDAVCFLDDDNLPDPDYIEKGISTFADGSLGLVISCVRPHWETAPSPAGCICSRLTISTWATSRWIMGLRPPRRRLSARAYGCGAARFSMRCRARIPSC